MFSLAIHGGAGTLLPNQLTPELEAQHREALQQALQAGYTVLQNGGDSLKAVEAAVVSLEDCPLFNAGRGSVFSADGSHEMEASIMCGHTLNAGAVAGIQGIKNPIALSRHVLDNNDYVYLSGPGAMDFAKAVKAPMAPANYFDTAFRREQWEAVRHSGAAVLDHTDVEEDPRLHERKFGTVGAVACDAQGNLAAATSTGGLTNKQFGRVGDSSVIGAGTYANNATCAISCTGYGEYFLRGVVAYDISCLMEYKGLSLQAAMETVIMEKQVALGGEGGAIGADAQGNTALVFNSAGMYRGTITQTAQPHVAIFKD